MLRDFASLMNFLIEALKAADSERDLTAALQATRLAAQHPSFVQRLTPTEGNLDVLRRCDNQKMTKRQREDFSAIISTLAGSPRFKAELQRVGVMGPT